MVLFEQGFPPYVAPVKRLDCLHLAAGKPT
jgi:hypothetical protein